MTDVHGSAPIRLPRATSWALLRDLSRADRYVPGVVSCRIDTAATEGVGASRTVRHTQSGRMQETVVDWRDGVGFTLRLHRGDAAPFPFAAATFAYRLEAAGPGDCVVHTTMSYALRWGPLGRLLDAVLFRRIAAQQVQAVAEALARHHETTAA